MSKQDIIKTENVSISQRLVTRLKNNKYLLLSVSFNVLFVVLLFYSFYEINKVLNEGPDIHAFKRLPQPGKYPYHCIVFCFNPNTLGTGHANLIEIEKLSKDAESESNTIGHSPKERVFDLSEYVDGGARKETNKELKDLKTSLIAVPLDGSKYDEYLKVKNKWINKSYRFTDQNCVTFVNEVAKAVGLNTPCSNPILFPPKQYINNLCFMNRSGCSSYNDKVIGKHDIFQGIIYTTFNSMAKLLKR